MRKRQVGTFDGPFAPMLDLYVKQKQAAGYDYVGGYNILRLFDKFSKDFEVNNFNLSKDLVVEWGKQRPNEGEAYKSARILHLQHFAIFLNAQGYHSYVSPKQVIHLSQHTAYVFTLDEMKRIFSVLDEMECSPCSPYKHLSFPLLYRMLYGCGFRISELINLTLKDVDDKNGIIHVYDAKNGNERPVPMSKSLSHWCREYVKTVHSGHGESYPMFFKKDGTNYCVSNIERNFREVLWMAGIPYYGLSIGPRVHDLRHTFICHRLRKWAQEDTDLLTVLPILSKYVGHSSINATQYYLKLTAEVFPDVLEKMESLTGKIIPEAGGDLL